MAGRSDRCLKVEVQPGLPHRIKLELARAMLERALDVAVSAGWVVAHEVYGSDGALRRALEARGQAYVLAVRGH